MSSLKTIAKPQLQELIDKKDENYVLIDVRQKEELTGEMPLISSATNVPLQELQQAFGLNDESFKKKYGFEKPKKDDRVIVYCRSGRRSDAAQRELLSNFGYTDVTNYTGSALDWYNKV
jgi:rhodanese-related sulfurtransferase